METRRQEILDSALDVFLERGFDAATLAEIRARSGASTGSIYHFFRGKADIATALLSLAVAGWSRLSPVAGKENDAEAAIRASVESFLRWGNDNRKLFAFIDEILARSGSSPDFERVNSALASGRAKAAALYADWVNAGLVSPISWDIAYGLIMGPAYAVLRTRPPRKLSDEDVAILVDAAWAAVRADATV